MSTPKSAPSPVEQFRPSAHAVTPRDRELFERHLASFVPPDAFDVHAHWYTLSGLFPENPTLSATSVDDRVGAAIYREQVSAWMGERSPRKGLFFGLPSSPTVNAPATNAFVAGGGAALPRRPAPVLVRPGGGPAPVGG